MYEAVIHLFYLNYLTILLMERFLRYKREIFLLFMRKKTIMNTTRNQRKYILRHKRQNPLHVIVYYDEIALRSHARLACEMASYFRI